MQQKFLEQGAKVKAEGNTTDDVTEITVGKRLAEVPRMPYFDEERDFMDSYLRWFEPFAVSYESQCLKQIIMIS